MQSGKGCSIQNRLLYTHKGLLEHILAVLNSCTLRKEVLKGDLDDAIFAADFGDLIAGKAPAVYGKAEIFFQNTHPAKQLCKVVEAVFNRLANQKEPGAAIRLSTGFGGGKTHTLMALWHLAQNIIDSSMGTDLLPAAGRPKKVAVVAVDCGKAGVPEFAKHGALKVHSLWGEIFYRLGGEKAVKALGKADDPEASPSETQITAAFPAGPVLVLLDELVIYMAALSERGQGNLLAFLGKLASVVGKRPQTVLVVTDPAAQAVYAGYAAKLADAMPAAAAKLDDVFDRKVSDFDPIGDESPASLFAVYLIEWIRPQHKVRQPPITLFTSECCKTLRAVFQLTQQAATIPSALSNAILFILACWTQPRIDLEPYRTSRRAVASSAFSPVF